MMHYSCHLWKQPTMGGCINDHNIFWNSGCLATAPTCQQNTALLVSSDCINDNAGEPFRIAPKHAAKANINRACACLNKVKETLRRLPYRIIEKIAGNIVMAGPTYRAGYNIFAETI